MDLQALDASLSLTTSRPPRGEAGNEAGRQFTAELNQALAQRRGDSAPRPETTDRSEDKTASANERPEPPPRRSEASEPRSRRQADAAARGTARQERREQDRVRADEARQGSPAREPRDDEATDVQAAATSDVADTETAAAPPSASSDAKPADGQTDPSTTPVVLVPASPAIPVGPAPASLVAADVAIGASADPAAPVAAVAPGAATPAAPVPADNGTLPPAAVPSPAEAAVPSNMQPVAAAAPALAEPAAANASTTPAPAAPPSQPVPAQTSSVQAAAPAPDDTAAIVPTPGMPASTAPASATPAPATDPILAITVAAELPAKPLVPAPLALQAVEESVLPAAPAEAAPAATVTVTASAVPPTGQTGSPTSQTEAQSPTPVVATAAAPADASAFGAAIETADAPVEAVAADQPAPETTQISQNVADRRTGFDQTVRAEQTQATRQNLPLPQPVADQLAIRIARQAQGGEGRISLQLRPETLGIVDVDIEVRKDGSMKAVLSVEKPETLEWLKRDAQHLERALQEVGVKTDSGSLNFALREQRQDGSGGFARSGARRGPDLGGGTEPAGRMAEARLAEVAARRMARGGVDVRI